MSGLREIVEEQRTHCPHCHKPIDLSEFASELFQRILRMLSKGERVMIAKFGSFTARYIQGHKINHFGEEKTVHGRNVIRFRAHAAAKVSVNTRFAKGKKNGERRARTSGTAPKKTANGSKEVAPKRAARDGAAGDGAVVVSNARRIARARARK